MPLRYSVESVAKLRNALTSIADRNGREWRVIRDRTELSVVNLMKQEFREGVDPSGSTWKPTVKGKAALVSKRIASSIHGRIEEFGILFFSFISWLGVHQEGHTWPAGGSHKMTFAVRKRGGLTKAGRLVSKARQKRMKLVFDVEAKHRHARVLPPRPSYPTSPELPPRWFNPIAKIVVDQMQTWHAIALR